MNNKGFSLIELMIVVAIIGILASFVYPSYRNYLIEGNRADVKSELVRIESKTLQYKTANRGYQGFTLASADANSNYPSSGTAKYTIAISNLTATTWTLTATPISSSSQAGDGIICLNEESQKFWSKGATACALSATSTWD